MTLSISELFKNEKFIKRHMIVSTILILALVGYIVFLHSSNSGVVNGRTPAVKKGTVSEGDISLMMADAEESLNNVYMNLLAGSRATFADGNVMVFSKNGEFSGYFNADNPNVSGYNYRVTTSADSKFQGVLNIFSRESSSYVKYNIVVTSDSSDIKLFNPSDNTYITLEY